jgi:hypothetical protein
VFRNWHLSCRPWFETAAVTVISNNRAAIPRFGKRRSTVMTNRKLVAAACCLGLLIAAGARISAGGGNSPGSIERKAMRITFSQPVRLPGVSLGSGTYIFEAPTLDVVQVLSGDRSRVYFQGFTYAVNRPSSLPRGQVVSLGESAQGVAAPITVWYPSNESTGRQFIYAEGH